MSFICSLYVVYMGFVCGFSALVKTTQKLHALSLVVYVVNMCLE